MKILKHSIYNLFGLGLPLVVAVFTIPILIKELGEARFGLLTLIWAVVSYFGLFDLGLGRALTQQLAVVLGKNKYEEVGPLVGTATVIMAALGLFAGLLMAAAASWGVSLINEIPDKQEAISAVYAMALAMPAIILTSGFRGILEARHAFGIINLIRLPMGLFTFLGPLVVVTCGQARLDWIAAVLVVGRVIACFVHAYYAWCKLPQERGKICWDKKLLKPLCISGGWLTIGNIVSPFMGYVDRFVIGAIISASAVAFYATPQEIVSKLSIVPGALTAVLFPAFAARTALSDPQTWKFFKEVVLWLFLVMLPITTILALFAHPLLSLWVTPEFAVKSTLLMQIFAFGMLISCLAQIPFTIIQSAGKAKVTAVIHSIELPIFLIFLWWLTTTYGVVGAATAWLLRIILDTLFMFYASIKILNKPLKCLMTANIWWFLLLIVFSFSGALFPQIYFRILWVITVAGLAAFFAMRSLKSRLLQAV